MSVDEERLGAWLTSVAEEYGREIAVLTYVLLSDEELLQLNREYLSHDTLTDVITFDTSDGDPEFGGVALEGECYISVERVRENAGVFDVSPAWELSRVMAHGLLHLCGLRDDDPERQRVMTDAEERALARLSADLTTVRVDPSR